LLLEPRFDERHAEQQRDDEQQRVGESLVGGAHHLPIRARIAQPNANAAPIANHPSNPIPASCMLMYLSPVVRLET